MTLRILLAEDQTSVARLVQLVLRARGHRVVAVQSCADALATLAGEVFDVVLLDLNLADGSGLPVLDALAEREGKGPAVVLMSGDPGGANEAYTARSHGMLHKPFDISTLEGVIARFM